MKRERNYNIELLRVLSCIFVVCIHVANVYSRSFATIDLGAYGFSVLVNTICRISVPIFFMISGALLVDQEVDLQKNHHRVISILRPLIGWSLTYIIWNYFFMERGYDLRGVFAEPVKRHLWYLYALVGIYITLPFWQKLFQGMTDTLVKYFAVLWISLLGINYVLALAGMQVKYPIPLVGSSCYLGYFLMGYVIYHYKDSIRVPRRICLLTAVLAFAVITAATVYRSFLLDRHYTAYLEYRNVLLGIASMCVFYAVVSHEPYEFSAPARCWVELISKHSFTIYLTHVFFLDIIREQIQMPMITSWIGIPIFAFVIFAVSFLFSYGFDHAKQYVTAIIKGNRNRQ
ncbi:MAG: acyltransferase [Lachnospiraceae bacterium]